MDLSINKNKRISVTIPRYDKKIFHYKAFTLFEILAVMIIIVITVGIVGISLKSVQSRNELQPFINLLYQKLNILEQHAILNKTEIGLSFYSNKIEVLDYRVNPHNTHNNQSNSWRVIDKIDVTNNIKLKYEVTEQDIFIKQVNNNFDLYNKNNAPEIIFSSGGQLTPFTLTISHPSESYFYKIIGRFSGELSLEAEN